jgi:DNA-directed RNA polymerase specialized sigma24 family protein
MRNGPTWKAETLLYRAHDLTYWEIADKMKKPVKANDNALQRLQVKLKRVLAERLAPFPAA